MLMERELWSGKQRQLVSEFAPGVLNAGQLDDLTKEHIIQSREKAPEASSLDLTVHGAECWKLIRGVLKPEADGTYGKMLGNPLLATATTFGDVGIELPARTTFVFRVAEKLLLDRPLYAHATGKSSIGRLDVLARLIADGQPKYDQIDPPFDGQLYVEVTPLTFPIFVRPKDAICQLRLFKGLPSRSRLRGEELKLYCRPILNARDPEELCVSVSVTDVPEGRRAAAFKAKDQKKAIPLGGAKDSLAPEDYWELVEPEHDGIAITDGAFYIMRSVERFRLPQDIAVYAEAMHESLGEMRIHYAGFVHPHFGASRMEGTPLIFEVRGHDVNVFLRENEVLAKLQYFRMSEAAEPPEDQAYEMQELKLAKQFRSWKGA